MFDIDLSSAAAFSVETHRDAYNAAFYELGFRWHWDQKIYHSVLSQNEERQRIRFYLETQQPHLLKAYDAEFLIDAIEHAKARCLDAMTTGGRKAGPAINWAELQQHQVGA